MSENTSNTKFFTDLPFIVKLLLQIFVGGIFGLIFRIIRFTETKTTSTLVVGILCVVPLVCYVTWIIDLISIIKNGTYTFYAN